MPELQTSPTSAIWSTQQSQRAQNLAVGQIYRVHRHSPTDQVLNPGPGPAKCDGWGKGPIRSLPGLLAENEAARTLINGGAPSGSWAQPPSLHAQAGQVCLIFWEEKPVTFERVSKVYNYFKNDPVQV